MTVAPSSSWATRGSLDLGIRIRSGSPALPLSASGPEGKDDVDEGGGGASPMGERGNDADSRRMAEIGSSFDQVSRPFFDFGSGVHAAQWKKDVTGIGTAAAVLVDGQSASLKR